jgi:hypothetical protein
MVDLKSATLPALVAEASRILFNAERALTVPESTIGISLGETILTITGSLPVVVTALTATGNGQVVFANRVTSVVPVLTGTALADLTADSIAEVIANAAIRLDTAEATAQAINPNFPAGVGVDYSITASVFTFTASLPYTASLDASGNQVITVTDYLV